MRIISDKLFSNELKKITRAAKKVDCDLWIYEIHTRLLKLEEDNLTMKDELRKKDAEINDLKTMSKVKEKAPTPHIK